MVRREITYKCWYCGEKYHFLAQARACEARHKESASHMYYLSPDFMPVHEDYVDPFTIKCVFCGKVLQETNLFNRDLVTFKADDFVYLYTRPVCSTCKEKWAKYYETKLKKSGHYVVLKRLNLLGEGDVYD